MALDKQVIRMSVEGSLDTKTDSKNVLPTDFLELENVRFTKTGSFTKRYGYQDYTKDVYGSTQQINSGAAVTTFKDELLRYSNDSLYSYSKSENLWIDKGITTFALNDEVSILANGNKVINPSHDTIANLSCYVYESYTVAGSSSVDYRIVDNVNGNVLATATVQASATIPHVCALEGKFFIFYLHSGTVKFRTINFSTPDVMGTAASVVTTSAYIVSKIGNRAYVIAEDTTGITAAYVEESEDIAGPISIADATGNFNRLSASAEQISNVRITYGKSSGGKLMTVLYSSDLTYAIHSPVELEASVTIQNISSIQATDTVNASLILTSQLGSTYVLYRYLVSFNGVVNSEATILYQAGLQSKLQNYNGQIYFAVSKNSSFLASGPIYTPFRTIFLADIDGNFLNKFAVDSGAFRSGDAGLPNLNIDGNKLCFAAPEQAEVQSNLATPTILVPTTLKKFCADFNTVENYFDASLGDNLHIAGGVLKSYDGNVLVEHSFLLTPEIPQFVSETGIGAVLPDGTYQYLVVYKWIDKWGQVHRSMPSTPLSYEVTGGPKKPTIRVFTLPFTSKTDVEIEVYRTRENGTVFYKRAYNYADRIINDKTVESITFADTMSNEELIENEVLYTTGGVLDNVSATSSKSITTYKGRLMLLLSDGYTLQYSKRREENGPVEFSEELKIRVDSFGGPGTAVFNMDDNLIVFKERAIFALTGEGPNSLGEQNDFREPQLITSDAGCIDINSVVMTPVGVMFKSQKGIYILKRNFSVEYIGKNVEAYNSLTITSANLLPDTNEIRFTTNSVRSLIYDYFHNKWSVDTNINAVDATVYNNIYTYIRANGDLMAETPGLFSDNGSYIKIRISSSWLQLAGIQGYQRFYKMLILGGLKSPHLLKVRFAYNFNPTWVHEVSVDSETTLPTDTYGSDATYGDSLVYGGEYPLYQFEFRPKIQKCQAIKFLIEDFKTDGNGEGLTLSNFAAEVGIKQGLDKKADAKVFGAG